MSRPVVWPKNECVSDRLNGTLKRNSSDRVALLRPVMWKRKHKLEAKAPEAAIFHGSGSCKREMNGSGSGSGSSKKILEAEAEAVKNIGSGSDKNLPLPLLWYLRQHFSFF